MKRILMTGVTGFLAGELLVLLSKDERIEKIYCLVRAASDAEAEKRLEKVFGFHGDYFDRKKVVPVVGDLAGETLDDQLKAVQDVDTIIHAAADTSFSPSHKENIQRVNVVGATNVAKWAAGLPGLKTFGYIGTSWICGCDNPGRTIYEDDSPNMSFNQLVDYTRSKTIGELSIRSIIPADKLLVMRPTIIMGDSRSWTPRSFVISWAIAAFDLLRLLAMNSRASCDIIPVDYATKAIAELLFNEERRFNTYHISSGKESSTNMELLLNAVGSNTGKPPFRFVDYDRIKSIRMFAKGQLELADTELEDCLEYLAYWGKTLNGNGSLQKLLWAVNFYYQFNNLDMVFDNTRLLADTTVGPSEPAHIYMGRNKEQLWKIDVAGDIDP
jgi:thioester reductase-like protein